MVRKAEKEAVIKAFDEAVAAIGCTVVTSHGNPAAEKVLVIYSCKHNWGYDAYRFDLKSAKPPVWTAQHTLKGANSTTILKAVSDWEKSY